MRAFRILPAMLLALAGMAWSQAPGPDLCGQLSEHDVRSLTGSSAGTFQARASLAKGTGSLCTFTLKQTNLKDDQGNDLPSPTVTLQEFRFATEQAAADYFKEYSDRTDYDLNTDSPAGMDEVAKSSVFNTDSIPRGTGHFAFIARHGKAVVHLSYTYGDAFEDKRPHAPMETIVLTVAGAHVIPFPTEDVCSRVPLAEVQALVVLGPADSTMAKVNNPGRSTCTYTFNPDDNFDYPATVTIKVERWLSLSSALRQLELPNGNRTLVHTADPADHAWNEGIYGDARGIHGTDVATVSLSHGETAASQASSFDFHMERVALLAAGASVVAVPGDPPIPALPQRTSGARLHHSAVVSFWNHPWLYLLTPILAFHLFRRYRRRQLVLYGIRASIRIDDMNYTGVKVLNSPLVRCLLTVTPVGGTPYQIKKNMRMNTLQANTSSIGQSFEGRIDPKNPRRILILNKGEKG